MSLQEGELLKLVETSFSVNTHVLLPSCNLQEKAFIFTRSEIIVWTKIHTEAKIKLKNKI